MARAKLFFIFLLLCSCASDRTKKSNGLSFYKKKYSYQDKAGEFQLLRESGVDKEKKLVTRYRVSSEGKVSEESIVFSKVGFLGKKLPVLMPQASYFRVWFDRKKYQSDIKVLDSKSLKVTLKSPESQWNNTKTYQLPSNNGVVCFFTQVVECAKRIGFFDRAIKSKSGSMKFTIVWDGFPYLQEQYGGLESKPFSTASLKYDNKDESGKTRFKLLVDNSIIFYFIDENQHFEKMFWPAQGLSVSGIE